MNCSFQWLLRVRSSGLSWSLPSSECFWDCLNVFLCQPFLISLYRLSDITFSWITINGRITVIFLKLRSVNNYKYLLVLFSLSLKNYFLLSYSTQNNWITIYEFVDREMFPARRKMKWLQFIKSDFISY